MKLFVYHTPEATPADTLPDCAVVIDVLRATTTIATALAAGAEAVQACREIDELMEKSDRWLPERRLRAGERGGEKIAGCDLGNSPLDCTPEVVGDKRLFLSTTNGTRALRRVENAPTVLTAAMVNRQTCVDYLRDRAPETVWLLGSGWQGSYSLEDTACAGAIAAQLVDLGAKVGATVGNDEVMGAIALYQSWQEQLLALFTHSSHGQRLLRVSGEAGQADLEYCARTDWLDILPWQKQPSVLVQYGS